MPRLLKLLVISATTSLMSIAIMASSAQAFQPGQTTAGAYPATLSGIQTNENVISNGVRASTCAVASHTGVLGGASESLAIAAGFANCTGNGATTSTVDFEGCTFRLQVTTQDTASTGFTQTFIDCPAGNTIKIDIWSSGVAHNQTKLCRLELPAQGPITGGAYHNVTAPSGKRGIEVTLISQNVTISRTYGTATACGAVHKNNGTWIGNYLWTATSGGLAVDLWID
jgi:hypothetical protein